MNTRIPARDHTTRTKKTGATTTTAKADAAAKSDAHAATTAPASAHAGAPIVTPGSSNKPVGGEAKRGVKGAQVFVTRGSTAVDAKAKTPVESNAGAASRAFMTKVVIELTHARDRLRDDLHIGNAEWARISKPEVQRNFTFHYRKDDGSLAATTGFRTVFSTIRGAGKGGLRVVPDLDQDTVNALASEMPAKTAIMNAPVGGAKGGFVADAKQLSDGEFARAMRGYVGGLMNEGWKDRKVALGPDIDVPAPDVGTSHPRVALMDIAVDEYLGWLATHHIEQVDRVPVPPALRSVRPDEKDGLTTPYVDAYLKLFADGTIANAALLATFTGKSVAKGGSLGRADATGLGVALSTLEVMKHAGALPQSAVKLDGKSVAVQGYGNVGRGAVLAYIELGAKPVSIAEFDGAPFAVVKQDVFTRADVDALDAFRKEHGTIRGFPATETVDMDAFWSQPVDILAPCARENVITDDVARAINAKFVVEGANGPTTHEGDQQLAKRGVTVVPDVFANAAGVTVSFYEMEQNKKGERWSLDQVNAKLAHDIPVAFARLAARQAQAGGTLRDAAFDVALSDFVTSLRAAAS